MLLYFILYFFSFKCFAFRIARSLTQTIRREQDAAYLESLRADQEKERRRHEELERKRRQEEFEQQMRHEEQLRKEVCICVLIFIN